MPATSADNSILATGRPVRIPTPDDPSGFPNYYRNFRLTTLDILGVIHRRRCLPIRALRLRRNFCRRKAPDCRARRLDLMVRQIEQLERHIKISNEAIALFVRFWLTSTPPLPDTARPAAKPKGASAMKVFVEALGRRLARGHPLAEELSAGVNGRSDRDAV